MVTLRMSPDDHRACELRYRDLLGRLHDMAERLERIERDQRTFLEILRDFRELVGLVVNRVRALHHRIDQTAAPRTTFPGHRGRITRHSHN
jgi:hypothetical protein